MAVVAPGCGDDEGKLANPELVARDFSFQPSELPVTAARQVTLTFTNRGEVTHNLSVPSIPEIDLDFPPGKSETLIFVAPATAGAVEFICKFHQGRGMKGTFSVRP